MSPAGYDPDYVQVSWVRGRWGLLSNMRKEEKKFSFVVTWYHYKNLKPSKSGHTRLEVFKKVT